MSIIQSVILGIAQGVTEFLPISSTAHLIIFPKLFGWEEQKLVFDTTLHLATALALVVHFWKDIVSIISSLFKDISKHGKKIKHYSSESIMGLKVVIGSIPAGVIGFLFGDFIEKIFRSVPSVIVFLLMGSFLMYLAEINHKKRFLVKDEISLAKSFKVGLFQSLALLPGFSRSGSTISGGMLLGLSRKEATRFSFLLSIPVVLFAGISKIFSSLDYFNMADFPPVAFGFIASFITGLFAIKFMLRFVREKRLHPFIYYRVALALFLIVLYIF
jgi:undecaprenyl-diphosphatase